MAEEVADFTFQKLVDAMLVADAVGLAVSKESIAVISEDEDILPGLITARCFGAQVMWLGHSAAPREPYLQMINKHRIAYAQC
jgi:hypothetical protein